ncbi:DUF6266 family protein [Mesohalobacter halotolerans]|nr:DUF6266 family protein [Mesohalobacter halotolerans]
MEEVRNDKALILLFNATRSESVFTTAGPVRTASTESIPVPSEYLKKM